MKDFKKSVLPHILTVLGFIVVLWIYFQPVFSGKTLGKGDILNYLGNSHEVVEYQEKTGETTLWTNALFGGMPAYTMTGDYPGQLLREVEVNTFRVLPYPVYKVMIALVCFYILLLTFKVKPLYAAIGAFAYAFSSYNIIILEAGHSTKLSAIGYAPLVIAGVNLVFRKKYWIGFGLTALAVGLEVYANHPQITYYLFLLLLVFGISELVRAIKTKALPEFGKAVGILLVAATIGVGSGSAKLMVMAEYSEYSIRGKSELTNEEDREAGLDKEYAFAWSNGIWEPFTILVPDFFGGPSYQELSRKSETYDAMQEQNIPRDQINGFIKNAPTYHGEQTFTSGPTYFGATVVFLFVLGMFMLDKKLKVWLFIGTIMSIVLSWGDNFAFFNYLIFDYFPLYNKFRAVTMILVIAQITVPVLGFIALCKAFESKNFQEEGLTKVYYALSVAGGLCLLLLMGSGMMDFAALPDQNYAQAPWLLDALEADRKSLLQKDALRSLFFIGAVGGVMIAFFKSKLKKEYAIGIIAVLVFADIWMVDRRYLNKDDFEKAPEEAYITPTEADKRILEDSTYYRVLNLAANPFTDSRTSYFHKSIGGYHGAKMRRYQDLIEKHISKNNMRVLNMLNTKYFIKGQKKEEVIQNPKALGNAWFVSTIREVNTPDEEISALNEFQPANTAIVDGSQFEVPKGEYSKEGNSIKLTSYKPDELTYTYEAKGKGFVVFSEVYYPKGWKATIDGEPADYIRANYILRAMEVPAGKHTISFKFEPETYAKGNKIAFISSILVLLSFAGGVVVYVLKEMKKPSKEEMEEGEKKQIPLDD